MGRWILIGELNFNLFWKLTRSYALKVAKLRKKKMRQIMVEDADEISRGARRKSNGS